MNATSLAPIAFAAPPVDDRSSAFDHLPADRVPLAVLDFETTGLRVGKDDRIVEDAPLRHREDDRPAHTPNVTQIGATSDLRGTPL